MASNPEIVAINAVDRAISKLPDESTRERVLNYIESKYITKVTIMTHPAQPLPVLTMTHPAQPVPALTMNPAQLAGG